MKIFIFLVLFSSLIDVGWSSPCPVESTILQNSSTFWCVWIIDTRYTISGMVRECRLSGGYVLVVKDDIVNDYLQETLGPILLDKGIAEEIWINYNTTSKESLEGDHLPNTYWETDGPTIEWPCVNAKYPDFEWNNVECEAAGFYGICYKEINCKVNGTYYIMSHDICYWLAGSEHSADDSETVCNMDGATLALIPDQEVMETIASNSEIQSTLTTKRCWIAINDSVTEGLFLTIKGDPVPYFYWHTSQPDNYLGIEDCAVLEDRNLIIAMNDFACYSNAIPLCFKWNATVAIEMPTTGTGTTAETVTMTTTKPVIVNTTPPGPSNTGTTAGTFPVITTDSANTTPPSNTGTTAGTVTMTTTDSVLATPPSNTGTAAGTVPMTTSDSTPPPAAGTTVGTVPITTTTTFYPFIHTSPAVVTGNPILCCPCPKKTYNTEYVNNTAALTQQLMKLKKETLVQSKNTSAYRNSLMCAKDDRPSAVRIGISASVIVFSVLGAILLMDVATMTQSLARPRRPKIR